MKIKWGPEEAGGCTSGLARFCPHPESEGARRRVRTCQKRPRPGSRVWPRGRGSPAPAPGCPPWPRRGGRNPGPEVSARRRQDCQGPSSGASGAPEGPSASCGARSRLPARPASLPAADAVAPAPAPRPAAARAAASPTWRARRASRTSQRDPAPLGTSGAGAGGCRETCSAAAAAAPASSSGRRQRTCCAACHGRSGSAAPPQPHNMAATASAGSRGAGREATGRAVDGPPARWRAPTRTPLGTRNWPGCGSSPPKSRGRGPRGPGPHARLFPRGGPEALDPAALPGGVPTHLAPPPRGDMLGLGDAFPATADPKVSEEGQGVSSTSLMQAPHPKSLWGSPWSPLTWELKSPGMGMGRA